MKSAVTISLVAEAEGGPFIYWDGLTDGCRRAKAAGFDAVEIFAPDAAAVDTRELRTLLDDQALELAAVGTGAGWVKHKLTLTDPDPKIRDRAQTFIKSIVDLGGPFGAPAIIGSMQGTISSDVSRRQGLGWLKESLSELGNYASQYQVPLIYEPLNRYESNVMKTQCEGAEFLRGLENVALLCDLFHMNIEEPDMAGALREVNDLVGHVHFVDSNRYAPGFGHIDFAPIADALREIDYHGYLSLEAFPLPDSDAAAQQMIHVLRQWGLVGL